METIKHVVAIDISMEALAVRFGSIFDDQTKSYSSPSSFQNIKSGFRKLVQWTQKQRGSSTAPVHFVMEATGVYYEALAYYLDALGYQVTVVLPNKIKHYIRSLDIKSKTDDLDTIGIVLFGLERPLHIWHAPSPLMQKIKALLRERKSLVGMITMIGNRKHAKEHSYQPLQETLKRQKKMIELLKKDIKAIERQIKELVASDPDLSARLKNTTKVKGLGWLTVLTVVAETNNFNLITSCKQLASYAGYDVVLKQSGKKTWKAHISKRGNSHIREALYMPALTACRCNHPFTVLYQRLTAKTSIKGVGLIAVARKLLLLIYTLWTKTVPYDANYGIVQSAQESV